MRELSFRILSYLADHPEASDTAEGIAQWWLLERRIDEELREVRAALTELMASRLVVESQPAGSGPRYRMNPERSEQVAALLGRSRG